MIPELPAYHGVVLWRARFTNSHLFLTLVLLTHMSIPVTLDLKSITTQAPACFQDWRNTDWNLFDSHLRNNVDPEALEPSSAIKVISRAISGAIDAAVPMRTRRSKPRVPWWYPELDRMSIRIKRAKRRMRSTPNPPADARARFNSLDTQWRRMISQARDDYHARQLAETDHHNVWRTIKRHNAHRRPIPPIDGAEDFEDKCNAFRDTLFPSEDATPDALPPDFVSSTADLRDEFHPVSRAEIDHVVARLNYGSAVGPDKLSYEAVRRFHACMPHILPRAFTDLFASV
jgi:hypothetical protein